MDPKNPINLDDIDFGHTLRGHQKGDRVFDRFVLEKLLGRGGMGVVWLAKDERLGREVALKFAPEAVRFDDLAVDELKEETRKGLELAHPNIVKIYDFLMDEEHAAISMEFIDGENLGALRARQPHKVFEPGQIAHWVGQLLEALDYAHRGAKVIHRDLKPANLMIDREGNLRVTDFGIARSISDAMTRATLGAGNSTGTLAYMSPQQADGKKPHVSDDLYAVGSTLYELLTGKPPFYTGNIAARLHEEPAVSVTERRIEFGLLQTEPIPQEWEHTVLSLLEKTPENRPASALAVRQRLGLVSEGAEVPPVPAIPGGQPGVHAGPHTGAHTPQTHLGGHTHVRSQTYVRQGGGLTEVNLPGRPILSGNVRLGQIGEPATSPATGPQTHTQPHTQPAPSGGGAGLWIAMIGGLMGLAMMAGAGWWVYNRTPLFKKKTTDPTVVQPAVKPTDSDPGKSTSDPGKSTPPPVVPTPTTPSTPSTPLVSNVSAPNTGPSTPSVPPAPNIPTPTVPTPSVPTPSVPSTPSNPIPPVRVSTLQAMINEAAPGSEVLVPEGNYEEQLRFKDGIKLRAAPNARVIVQTDGRVGSALLVENCKSGSISGITFQHTGAEVTEKVSWPVVMLKSSSITLENCTIQSGVSDGMVITGVGRPQVLRCAVRSNTKNGIVLESGVTALLDGTECRQNGESGLEARHSGTSANVQSCSMQDNGLAGLAVKDGASLSVLQKTRCQNNKDAGISAAGEGVTLTVTDVVCEGNRVGIGVEEYAKASIKECTIKGSEEAGIQFRMALDGSEVVKNNVEGSKGIGLLIGGANGTVVNINGNKVTGGGSIAIGVFGAGFKPKVEGNECLNNADRGIYATEGVSGLIKENTVRGNNRGAIDTTGASQDLMVQGNITDGA